MQPRSSGAPTAAPIVGADREYTGDRDNTTRRRSDRCRDRTDEVTDVVSAISGSYANATTTPVSSTGELSLTVGDNSYPLTLATDANDLNGLRDAINAADASVTAAVLPTGLGTFYMQVVASSSGSGDIQIYADPSGANTPLLTSTTQIDLSGASLGKRCRERRAPAAISGVWGRSTRRLRASTSRTSDCC